jgi:hypothetical protein
MLGLELKTQYGWGRISKLDHGRVVIDLEFAGLKSTPILCTTLTDKIILHTCKCAVGTRVLTKYGSGVVTNYIRSTDMYVVRLWSASAYGTASGSGIGYMPQADLLRIYANGETPGEEYTMRGLDGAILSENEAIALPTVELILSGLPSNAGMHRTALDLITNVMMGMERVHSSAGGEGIVVALDEEGSVVDTSSIFRISQMKQFLADIRRTVADGEEAVLQHITAGNLDPEEVQIVYDHWKRVSQTIQDIVKDFQLLFAAEDAEAHASQSNIEAGMDDAFNSVPLSSDNIYEFMCKLRTHITTMRIYFDVTDDMAGLVIISQIISNFREAVFKPFELLPEMLKKKLESVVVLPNTRDAFAKVGLCMPSDRRGLARRVALIISKFSPSTGIFFSTPSLRSFRDLEAFLTTVCEFFEKSNLPGVLLRGLKVKSDTSLKQLMAMELPSAGDFEMPIGLEDIKLRVKKEGNEIAQKVSAIDINEFRCMIYHLIVSITQYNSFSGYGLRKKLVDSPQIGLVLMICHLYQAKELQRLPLVRSIHESIPSALKAFLSSSLLRSSNVDGHNKTDDSEKSTYLTLNDIISTLQDFDNIAETLLSNTDQLVTSVENVQTSDKYQFAMAHLSTLDINLADSARRLVLSSHVVESKDGDSPDLFSAAEVALTDEHARARLIDSVKDSVLDFLVSYIPTINIATLDGMHENVEYSISGLDLSGFQFDKNSVELNIADDIASGKDLLNFSATHIVAKFSAVQWRYKKLTFPYLSGAGTANASVENASIRLGFKIVRLPKGVSQTLAGELGTYKQAKNYVLPKYPALAADVACLRQSASMAGISPKGAASKDRDMWGPVTEWEPVLLISHKAISIETLSLEVQGSGWGWLYNMLASIFSNVLKERICTALTGLISSSSSALLSVVNGAFASKWGMLQRMLSFDIRSVPSCSAAEFLSLVGEETDTASAKTLPPREYTLKFNEEGPLGLTLTLVRENAASNLVTRTEVGAVVPDSQASRVCDSLGWPHSFLAGATVLTVNGARLSNSTKEHVYELLSNRRPLFICVKLSEAEYASLQRHTASVERAAEEEARKYFKVTFQTGPMGMVLEEFPSTSQRPVVVLKEFSRGSGNVVLQAEASGKIQRGCVLLAIDGQVLLGRSLAEIQLAVSRTARPASVLFARDATCAAASNAIHIKTMFA